MRHLTADLRAGVFSARREPAAARDVVDVARDVDDAGRIRLNEHRLRCLSVAAAEYGIRLADPVSQAAPGGHAAVRG